MNVFLFVLGTALLLVALYAGYKWAKAWRDKRKQPWWMPPDEYFDAHVDALMTGKPLPDVWDYIKEPKA